MTLPNIKTYSAVTTLDFTRQIMSPNSKVDPRTNRVKHL